MSVSESLYLNMSVCWSVIFSFTIYIVSWYLVNPAAVYLYEYVFIKLINNLCLFCSSLIRVLWASESMRAKATNHTGFGKERQYTASNDRGNQKNIDNTKLRYVYPLVIVSVIIFVANILLDLRYN